MPSEQWRTGLIQITNGSQLVIGTASCDWANQIEAGHVLKVNEDNEATYTVASILSATRLQLSANYGGTGGTGISYVVCRSFTTSRGYWRPLQGDSDWAEIMSQETIDKIDTDIQNLSASVNINASNIIDIRARMANANASISSANASISALQTNVVNANASISAIKAYRLIKSEKVTVGHAALVNTASQYIKIYRASPGDSILDFVANITASLGLTATPKAVRISVGEVADTDGYAKVKRFVNTGWKWMEESNASKGAYFKNASGYRISRHFTAGADIRALFSASAGGSGMLLASLDKGSIDFYLDIMSRA